MIKFDGEVVKVINEYLKDNKTVYAFAKEDLGLKNIDSYIKGDVGRIHGRLEYRRVRYSTIIHYEGRKVTSIEMEREV